ncbi:MAG TPA: hypothetical protein VJT71_15225 [Pyrinomonadaceae bacterium]|nr:hypothetical protein [Pyrinomonadaceae bacterium]
MSKGPKQVLIIRHGEKCGDPKQEDDGGNNLSIRGSARAIALPSLFAPAQSQLACDLVLDLDPLNFAGVYETIPIKGTRPRFPTPEAIFATAQSKHSQRPIETVTPLAIALNLHLNDRFADKDADIDEMVNVILNQRGFLDKTILICWHHGKIPQIAKAFGIRKPPKWDGKVFDRVWQLSFAKGKAKLEDLPQMLLYGDSSK